MPRLGCTTSPPVPWGTHLCSFYHTPSQLHELISVYLSRGLQDHEGCLWILPPWHTPTTATTALQWVVPHVYDYLATTQLELIASADWYGWPGPMDISRICADGRDRITRMSARFAGLRVVGNLSWVTSPEQRAQLVEYERVVDELVQAANVLALCTYPAAEWRPLDRQNALRHHQSVLLPNQVGWRLVDVSGA